MHTIDESYAALNRLRSQGRLRLYLLLAPPRTGSTAMTGWFAHTSIDGQICEPWAKFQSGEQRLADGYRDILTHAEYLLATRHHRPVSLVLKVISQHIGPYRELADVLALVDRSAVLVRNPVLAIESQIISTAKLLSMIRCGPSSLAEMAGQWLVPEASLDHLDPDSELPLWDQHVQHMVAKRDYTSLSSRIWFASNQLFGSRSLQTDVWLDVHRRLPAPDAIARRYGFDSWTEMVTACVGAPIEAMRDLDFPEPLRRPFAHGQAGWMPLKRHYRSIRRHRSFAGVLDFGDMQSYPEAYGRAVCEALGIELRDDVALTGALVTGYVAHEKAHPGLEHLLFQRARSSPKIETPAKEPLEWSRFRRFVRTQMPRDLRFFARLTTAPERVRVPSVDPMYEFDPVQAYIHATVWQRDPARAARIRERAAHHQPYFRMIDAMRSPTSISRIAAPSSGVPGR
ncbi:hypothetical protein [Haliangium sp.]|uniref:hypothetical protein n=1 Tax=Haliangium sp. TaxID=2663208 RepID=UPI003D0DA19C